MSRLIGGRSFDEPGKNLDRLDKPKRMVYTGAMNLYLIQRTDDVWYDNYDSFVVRATDAEAARALAAARCADEGAGIWFADTTKVHHLGVAGGTKAEIVLGSFNAG